MPASGVRDVIFELLQNAEDAGATQVTFELFEDRLEVRHDGRDFNEDDVRGVRGVGKGAKAGDRTQIGKFGIGFKSVYAYTRNPGIHSGGEHFRIPAVTDQQGQQARISYGISPRNLAEPEGRGREPWPSAVASDPPPTTAHTVPIPPPAGLMSGRCPAASPPLTPGDAETVPVLPLLPVMTALD